MAIVGHCNYPHWMYALILVQSFIKIFFEKGGGGQRRQLPSYGGQGLYYCFLSVKNNIVLINLFILRGLGACSPRKF